MQTTDNWMAESMGKEGCWPDSGGQPRSGRAHRGVAYKFLSGGRTRSGEPGWLPGDPVAAERGLLPTCLPTSPSLPLISSCLPLSLPSCYGQHAPGAPSVPAPRSPGNRADRAAGKELGGASRPGSTGGQTEAQRAEGPCPKPHIQDQAGVKGHLGAQVRLLLPCGGDN